jgi:hypothetical protein
MSFQITTAFVQQYRSNAIHLSQQKGSKLERTVRVESDIVGKNYFFERIGATAAVLRAGRHSDTPLVSTPHSRRMVTLGDYEWADLVDNVDKIRLLIDPQSEYVIAGVNAMGRAKDDLLIAAATGNAFAGEMGTIPVALPAGQVIVNGGTNLTLAKIAATKRILEESDVDTDEQLTMVVSPRQVEYLLVNVAELKSSDYNTVKALVAGEINQYYGFTWVISTRLALAAGIRSCLAYAKSGLGLAIGADIKTDIDKRPDKSNSIQVFLSMTLGATRIEDEKVVQIDCAE